MRAAIADLRLPVTTGDLLLRETHHRCSNDLQLIVSLLSLQSRRVDSVDARAALSDAAQRVAALASARAAMFGGESPSLEAALGQLCEALHSHAEPRSILVTFRVDQPVGRLSAERIAPLTLVVNELMTNAIKHAFAEGTSGQITVTVGRSAEGDVIVTIDDDGRPFPDSSAPDGSGMGLGLAKRLMASIDGVLIAPTGSAKLFELRVSSEHRQVSGMTIDSPRFALQGTTFDRPRVLSAEDRRALGEIATAPRQFRVGIDLVSEAVRTDMIFVVTGGWACRYKMTRDGARQITGLVVPGDVCNLDSFMLPQVNFGVRTLTALAAIRLPRERVQALAAKRPAIARAFTWLISVENAVLSEWALSLGRQTARERLAHLFCELAVRLGGTRSDTPSYELPVTQEQLADALGITSVHVNRTLQQLRADGLVAIEAGRVTLPDLAALRRVGGFDGAYLHADAS